MLVALLGAYKIFLEGELQRRAQETRSNFRRPIIRPSMGQSLTKAKSFIPLKKIMRHYFTVAIFCLIL